MKYWRNWWHLLPASSAEMSSSATSPIWIWKIISEELELDDDCCIAASELELELEFAADVTFSEETSVATEDVSDSSLSSLVLEVDDVSSLSDPCNDSVTHVNKFHRVIYWIWRHIVGCRGEVQLGVQILGITGVLPLRWGLESHFCSLKVPL